MKDKSLRQYITELERIAGEFGDDLPVLLKFTPAYIPYCPIYRDLKVRVERPKTSPRVVVSVKK
jgi:hypothetical protein